MASMYTCAGRQEANEWVTDGKAWLSIWLQSANASGTSGLSVWPNPMPHLFISPLAYWLSCWQFKNARPHNHNPASK